MTHKTVRKIDVAAGSGWTRVPLLTDGTSHQIQNTSEVVLEYALTPDATGGVQLLPYEFSEHIHADIYVRFYFESVQSGNVAVLTVEPEIPMAFPNAVLVNGTNPEQAEVTLTTGDATVLALFRNPAGSGKAGHLVSYNFTAAAPSGNEIGEVLFQLAGVVSLTGTPSYAPVASGVSVFEVAHIPGTGVPGVAVTAGFAPLTVPVEYVGSAKGGNAGQSLVMDGNLGLSAYEGDVFALVAKHIGTAASIKVRFSMNWKEEI